MNKWKTLNLTINLRNIRLYFSFLSSIFSHVHFGPQSSNIGNFGPLTSRTHTFWFTTPNLIRFLCWTQNSIIFSMVYNLPYKDFCTRLYALAPSYASYVNRGVNLACRLGLPVAWLEKVRVNPGRGEWNQAPFWGVGLTHVTGHFGPWRANTLEEKL